MGSRLFQPMTVRRWRPRAELRPFVEAYGVREVEFGMKQAYVPLPARRDFFLEFYLQDRYRVVTLETGAEHWAPRCVLVGPSTQPREDLKLSGSLEVFSIRFSPVGFRALFRIPARLLCDRAIEAELVLGPEVVEVHEQLAAAEPTRRQTVVERYLLKREQMHRVSAESRAAAQAAAVVQRSRGMTSVAELAVQSAVSPRHLERAFQEQIGVSPKMFGRLLRLDHAVELGESEINWAEVASICGYFDQSHMLRDFREMNGATPAECVALRAAPPRSRGQCRIFPIRREDAWVGWGHEDHVCCWSRSLLLFPNGARTCST